MKGRKSAGGSPKVKVNAGADSTVVKAARSRSSPGIIRGMKRGGKVPTMIEGTQPMHHRLDRPGRKRGGAVGADMKPLTTAARLHGGMSTGGKA